MIEKDEETTTVIFRKWRSGDKEIIALFPYLAEGGYSIGSYESVGGHGQADYRRCINSTTPAKPEEYKDVQEELENYYGYRLKITKRANQQEMIKAINDLNQRYKNMGAINV